MARLARVVIPGIPHHVTQRGNRRQPVFFSDDDYLAYLDLLTQWSRRAGMAAWAYCLMPNHVHIIAVPERQDSLHGALGETHRRYSCRVNCREGWRGHLWQGRFASYPMDKEHTLRAVRYVELNPVRAGLVQKPEDWRWSSARAHILGVADELVDMRALAEEVIDWEAYLQESELELFRRHERTGRPLGDTDFLQKLEILSGRTLMPRKRGPKVR
ncbi:transposase [Desulfovibrio sp. OttesenSCG-928-M16]|nr:transposase [Desulfovibrio sp. OttesenSCG-928-M16]